MLRLTRACLLRARLSSSYPGFHTCAVPSDKPYLRLGTLRDATRPPHVTRTASPHRAPKTTCAENPARCFVHETYCQLTRKARAPFDALTLWPRDAHGVCAVKAEDVGGEANGPDILGAVTGVTSKVASVTMGAFSGMMGAIGLGKKD